jgi:hypothetical protein
VVIRGDLQASAPLGVLVHDGTIGGDFRVTGLRSCWFGTLRVHIKGDALYAHNTFADPDASEVNSNVVAGDLSCFGNSPAVQFGDAVAGVPNQVSGDGRGECGFHVLLHNPPPSGPLTPSSVRAGHHHGY